MPGSEYTRSGLWFSGDSKELSEVLGIEAP